MFISVTVLCERGKRLSAYAIKTQAPTVGWLHYEIHDYGGFQRSRVRARLVNEAGADLLEWLDHARLVTSRGRSGALIEGVQFRKKGSKHSISDQQAWWCEAPPREQPLVDHAARVKAAEIAFDEQIRAWRQSASDSK